MDLQIHIYVFMYVCIRSIIWHAIKSRTQLRRKIRTKKIPYKLQHTHGAYLDWQIQCMYGICMQLATPRVRQLRCSLCTLRAPNTFAVHTLLFVSTYIFSIDFIVRLTFPHTACSPAIFNSSACFSYTLRSRACQVWQRQRFAAYGNS